MYFIMVTASYFAWFFALFTHVACYYNLNKKQNIYIQTNF